MSAMQPMPVAGTNTVPKPKSQTSWTRKLLRHWTAYAFIAPFMVAFLIFKFAPILVALSLSLFKYDAVTSPRFIGFDNFLSLFTEDYVFLRHALPNTFYFAVIVGPLSYALCFGLAWLINQLSKRIRDVFTIAIYIPSMASGVNMGIVWIALFAGDRSGYLNRLLLKLGFIDQPIIFFQNPQYFVWIVILITVWQAMGIGFLAILAGLQTINAELYEAGAIDGIGNRLQEIFYITIPSIRPQMLFSAVMGIIGTLNSGIVSGGLLAATQQNIPPGYQGWFISNHIDDYFINKYEVGYSAALTCIMLLIVIAMTRFSFKLFGPKGDE